MEENKKQERGPLVFAGILLIALLVCLVLLVVRLASRGVDNKEHYEEQIQLTPELEDESEQYVTEPPEPTEKLPCEVKQVEFIVQRYLEHVYIVRKDGYYGMADLEGNYLIEPKYNKLVYFDNEWVGFEDENEVTHVFNRAGEKLYEYVCFEGQQTEENGRQFARAVFYRQGMKIEFDYNERDDYYGIHYYNAESGELIFELADDMAATATENWQDLQISSLPDESGVAVVIAGDGFLNTMYLITKDGYTSEEYREDHVERRIFHYSDHSVWNRTNLINGWLLTTVEEERGDILEYTNEWTQILYNIHTKERVPLPEEYQNWYGKFYQHSEGLYYGMSGESYYDYEEEQTEVIYYAVCHGSKKLTEELYQWIKFDDTYIIAGNDSFSHILDYEGKVLAEYQDVAFPFVDGRTLVCDATGAFYIDEMLQPCSGYVMKDVDYCHPGYIRKDGKNYLVKWTEAE